MSNVFIAEFLLTGGEVFTEENLLKKYNAPSLANVAKYQDTVLKDLPTMYKLYHDLELPIDNIVKEMHDYGIFIDKDKLTKLKNEYEEKRNVFVTSITEKLGPINLNSPRQLGQALVLEHKLNLPKTKTGQYSTTSEVLTAYSKNNDVVREILEFRALDKIINTYILPILDRLDTSSRIHPKYDLMSAATGRLASSDPNIQSTPVSGVYGEAIRRVFAAPTDSLLIGFDYSQQELRILAHLSQDPKLMDAFEKNIDIHILTASKVLGIPEDKIGKSERSIGKTLNFGIIYGETPYGLARQLGKSPEECAGILRRYFETYYGVKKYFDNLLTHAKIHGYVETLLGRRRGIPGQKIYTTKKSLIPAEERIIKNFPIQGSAADMTKKAMIDIHKYVLPKYPQAHMVMQIHDELVFEYTTRLSGVSYQVSDEKTSSVILPGHSEAQLSEGWSLSKDLGSNRDGVPLSRKATEGHSEMANIESFVNEVKSLMEKSIPISVPVVVDAKVGNNWAEV